jgi:hypothetical protein
MHMHIAVITESGSDSKSGSDRATERINENVHTFAFVGIENVLHVAAVEVIASDKAAQVEMVVFHSTV